jgi:hypothetical protein
MRVLRMNIVPKMNMIGPQPQDDRVGDVWAAITSCTNKSSTAAYQAAPQQRRKHTPKASRNGDS